MSTLFRFLSFILLVGVIAGFGREASSQTFTTGSCTGTSSEMLASNGVRRAALIVNDGTATVWIKIGATALANEGIRLNANGGSYYIALGAPNYDTEAVNCISAGATIVILLSEWS